MSQLTLALQPLTRTAVALGPRSLSLLISGVLLAGGALLLPAGPLSTLGLTVAGTMAALALIVRWLSMRHQRAAADLNDRIAAFVELDASPSFTTDPDGAVQSQNRAAVERFGTRKGQTLTRSLGEIFANPAAILYRMQTRAATVGAAREDLVTRRGHVRLAVHRIAEETFLWRLEDMAERAVGGRGAETISLPMLTVSKAGTVLFMNEALRRIVGERVRTLDRIFRDLPLRTGSVHQIIGPEGPVTALTVVIEGANGRSEVYLLPRSGRTSSRGHRRLRHAAGCDAPACPGRAHHPREPCGLRPDRADRRRIHDRLDSRRSRPPPR